MPPLYKLDQAVFRFIHHDLHRDWLDPFFFVISSCGLGWVQVILIALAAFASPYARGMAPILVSTFAISGLSSSLVKSLVPRMRPSHLAYAQPQEGFLYGSFPSGHTTTSIGLALAIYFWTRKSDHAWIGKAALGLAVLVGISRIYRGVHWPSDVLGGMATGACGAFLTILIVRAAFPRWAGPNPESPSVETSHTEPT